MKLKLISKLLISSLFLSNINIISSASSWSEDKRYETISGDDINIDNILEDDTANITIEDFNASEDMEKKNAVNLIVSSSLPYKVNASLESEIYNSDKSDAIDKSVLNIKNSSDTAYKAFNRVSENIILLDNQIEGDNISHSLDLILRGGSTHKPDAYKTTLKFEVEQK